MYLNVRSVAKKVHMKNMLLLKNPQFFPNHYKNLSKQGIHKDLEMSWDQSRDQNNNKSFEYRTLLY